MKYMGSKNRISKYIAPIIQSAIDDNHIETFVDAFVGGANLIDKIQCKNRIGNDIHKELIAMWKALQEGKQPPEHISEELYNDVKNNRDKYEDWLVGYVGFHASFGARYFNGYARDRQTGRDLPNEAYRNTMTQLPKVQDVTFYCGDYKALNPHNSVVYCDIPYEGTTKYKTAPFKYDEFWQWCRDISEDNIVFVSSYEAPDDFDCLWQKDVIANFSSQVVEYDKKKRTERLFTVHNDNKMR